MFIQRIKNEFKTACRKASQTSGIDLREKSALKRMFLAFEIHRTQSLFWHNGQATYGDSNGVFVNNPTSRKAALSSELSECTFSRRRASISVEQENQQMLIYVHFASYLRQKKKKTTITKPNPGYILYYRACYFRHTDTVAFRNRILKDQGKNLTVKGRNTTQEEKKLTAVLSIPKFLW